MQNAMSLDPQARAAQPWARAWTPRRNLSPLASLALALGVLAAAAPPQAWQNGRTSQWNTTADGRLVEAQVLVEGDEAPLFFRPGGNPLRGGGDDRWYFQAFAGRNYALQLRNTTGRRIGVLIAVDGLNVVNGERSRLGRGEPMYVLDPYETATIRGWRTSLDQVRKFVFVDEQRSYAERTGQANGDMGWIRVLAFNEAGGPRLNVNDRSRPYGDLDERARRGEGSRDDFGAKDGTAPQASRAQKPESEAPRAMAGIAPEQENAPGTGWGERSHDQVGQTWFVAASRPGDQLNFRYEYASGLQALGIMPYHSRVRDRDQGDLGFARPPRW
jgi:hypothetical protein